MSLSWSGRFSRLSLATLSLSLGTTGCASLLGLDDFTEGEDAAAAGTESSSSTQAGPGGPGGPGVGGGDPGATSTNSTQSGPGGGGVGGDGGGPPGELVVTPGDAHIGILRPLQLEANIDVTWAVEEGDEGGSIDENGFYISPDVPGTYHVVATSVADEGVTDTVEIEVAGLTVSIVSGQPGGRGNIDGPARKAHFDGPYGIGVDRDDSQLIFITDRNNHTIRKWDEDSGLITTLAGKAGEDGFVDGTGPDARFSSPTDIVVDGTIWVVDYENDCIRSVNRVTGATETFAGECGTAGTVNGSTGASSRFDSIRSMVLGPNGDALYVCQDGGSGRAIRKVLRSTGQTTTVIANFSGGCVMAADFWRRDVRYYDYDNDLGSFAIRSFPDPQFLGWSPDNVVVLGDTSYIDNLGLLSGYSTDKLYTARNTYDEDTDTQFVQVYSYQIGDAGEFTLEFGDERGYVDGDISDARTTGVSSFAGLAPYGYLFFTDQSDTVRRYDVDDDEVTTVFGSPPNIEAIDGPKNVARIPFPISLATDDAGHAFVGSFGEDNRSVRRIDIATGAIERFSGKLGDFNGIEDIVDGDADEAVFGIVTDIVFLNGNLYVVDYFANTVRRVDAETGAVTTLAGTPGVSGSADGFGASAEFRFAGEADSIGGGITTDGVDLFVADTGNFAIRKIDPDTGEVTTIAGGTEGSADGSAETAEFAGPTGITYDAGIFYITDMVDSTVRRFDVAGDEITTIAGRPGEPGTVDGGQGTSKLDTPFRAIADRIGNIYVSDIEGHVIRRVHLDGNDTTTMVGEPGQAGFNAVALPTTVNCPTSMVVDENGDLLFADACDGVVALLEPL